MSSSAPQEDWKAGMLYIVGCLLVVDYSDGFKWVCYPRVFHLRRGVGVKLVFVEDVTVIPAVSLGFGVVSVESVKLSWGVEAIPHIIIKAETITGLFC